jgi:calcium-translocating P-type ATPase
MKFEYSGLTDVQVQQARTQYGSNSVTTQEVEGFSDKLKSNLKDPIIIILLVALGITVLLSVLGFAPWYEGVGIFLAVALATLVATWSEYSNESEFQKLLEEASLVQVKTFRNSKLQQISIDDLVVGDHVLLQPGDTVPADGYLLDGKLEANQAALTGESEPIKKLPPENENQIDEDRNGLPRAALIDDGEGVMKVTAVGDQTKYGQTMKELVSAEDRLSPLQEKLADLGDKISKFGYIGSAMIAMAFMFNHIFIEAPSVGAYFAQPFGEIVHHIVTAIVLAIIIIVVAVPEGLPMMIATVLSMNMRKLLRAKVLVRKLLGIETAGSLTVLFSDKTGTLTQGVLQVADVIDGAGKHHATLGEIPEALRNEIIFSLRNNTSASIDTTTSKPTIVGANPTEQAMLRFLGENLADKDNVKLVQSIPFKSLYKFSASQVEGERNLTMVKGAAEIVLQNCTSYLDENGQKQALPSHEALLKEMNKMSERAMRLIALAITDNSITEDPELPKEMTLVGIFGLRDEIRNEARIAVQEAQSAGIRVVMITGDAKNTARAIAKELGLIQGENPVVTTSSELAEMSDEQVRDMLPDLCVVARALPTDKSRLVKAAKERQWVVGMTGDGVNDAPAVKNADVGFAMGSGTEMTKESSDIVILDDNFSSLTKAVLYGRTLLKSIRKFLIFQLSVNVAAILIAFFGPFLGVDLPLTMTQLLWVNLVMDTLAAIAFSGEAALRRYMQEKPIPKNAPLITNDMWSSILVNGVFMAVLGLFFLTSDGLASFFACDEARCGLPTDPDYNGSLVHLTAFFGFFVFINNFNKFNARTDSTDLFEHISENKNFLRVIALIFGLQILFTYIGGEVLRTVGLYLSEWIMITLLAGLIIPVDLLRKRVRNRIVEAIDARGREGMREGMAQGQAHERVEIARHLVTQSNMSAEAIATATSMKIDEVERLREGL